MLQVRAAAEEYHAEFAAKETTILTLTAEAEATRAHMQGEIEKLRTEMEVSAATPISETPSPLRFRCLTLHITIHVCNTCAPRWSGRCTG